jgi:hypothetical protein
LSYTGPRILPYNFLSKFSIVLCLIFLFFREHYEDIDYQVCKISSWTVCGRGKVYLISIEQFLCLTWKLSVYSRHWSWQRTVFFVYTDSWVKLKLYCQHSCPVCSLKHMTCHSNQAWRLEVDL